MSTLGTIANLIERLRGEVLTAPETEYRKGYLDALTLLEQDIYDELGEDE